MSPVRRFGLAIGALALLLSTSLEARAAGGEAAANTGSAPASRVEQDFVAANELALKGDTKGAIALYKTLLEQGVAHEDLYLNLGNAYAQSGKLVDAVVAYERALRLAPGDRDVRANLALVRKKLGADPTERTADGKVTSERSADVVVADVVEPLVAPLPVEVFGLLASAANLGLFAALYFRRRATTDRAKRRFTLLSVFAGVLVAVGLAVVSGHYVVARDPRAVILESTDLKEGPHARFKASGRIVAGERVRALEEDGGFVRVLRTDGTSGWVGAKTVERL